MACRSVLTLVLLAVAAFSSVVGTPSPAAADCSGPTIKPIDAAVRGEVITIDGYAWGDNCYDTGPPPDGEGVLGVPVSGIELFIVQGDDEVLVAAGSANEEYEFSVDVMVPSGLAPGAAQVVARWGTDRSGSQAFEILAGDPVAAPATTFGPVAESTPDPTGPAVTEPGVQPTTAVDPAAADDEGGDSYAPVAYGVLALVLIGGAGAVWAARRRGSGTT